MTALVAWHGPGVCPTCGTVPHSYHVGRCERRFVVGFPIPGTLRADMPRGRPPKDGETLAERVPLRAGVDQKAAWQAAADLEGVDLSTWIRSRLDTAAEKETR